MYENYCVLMYKSVIFCLLFLVLYVYIYTCVLGVLFLVECGKICNVFLGFMYKYVIFFKNFSLFFSSSVGVFMFLMLSFFFVQCS
jgi:hypothetical protein